MIKIQKLISFSRCLALTGLLGSGILCKPVFAGSGPVTTPPEYESMAIQNAPEYDTEDARTYIDSMPEIRALADTPEDSEGLTAFGAVSPSEEAFLALREEVEKLTADGHIVSMIMVDLRTKSGVSCRSSVPMCSQSTIKGIYIGSVLEGNPAALEENGQYMHDAVVYSKNEPYTSLWDTYGSAPLEKWCKEAGVDPSFGQSPYPRDKTARDMFKMWTRLYCYLNSDEKIQHSAFASWFADSSCSAAKKQLGDRYPVQTKAGWEHGLSEYQNFDPYAVIPEIYTDGDPVNDECSINDTGVVYTENGPYIFVIYTDYPFGVFMDYTDINPLYDLTEALCRVQASIAANSVSIPESKTKDIGNSAGSSALSENAAGPDSVVISEKDGTSEGDDAEVSQSGQKENSAPGKEPTATPLMVPAPDRVTQKEHKEDIYLILVNKTHRLPDDWVDRIELITVQNSQGREFEIEPVTYEHFSALREKLLSENIDIEMDSTYRSVERQQELWEEFEKEYGREYCEQYVAVPGYSEHHTGLVVDICLIKKGRVIDDNDDMLAERKIFSRIHALLPDYGFILRYMEGKENITGYSYEPWHLRYVGEEAAREITDRGITLEEYLADQGGMANITAPSASDSGA